MRRMVTQARWTDAAGTEWTLVEMPPIRGLPPRLGFRSRDYAFVTVFTEADSGEDVEVDGTDLQRFVDRATEAGGESQEGSPSTGIRTARLWIDPRSRTEWEVELDAGEILFRRGTQVVRAPRGDGEPSPRAMDDEELQEALDRAQAADD
jgi:hypothetical protein